MSAWWPREATKNMGAGGVDSQSNTGEVLDKDVAKGLQMKGKAVAERGQHQA
jgi:hypothetical protein